jgi:hypothetical protein
MRTTDQVPDEPARGCADSGTTPAIGDRAADDCAGARADCRSLLCRRARSKRSDHSNGNNEFFHEVYSFA